MCLVNEKVCYYSRESNNVRRFFYALSEFLPQGIELLSKSFRGLSLVEIVHRV